MIDDRTHVNTCTTSSVHDDDHNTLIAICKISVYISFPAHKTISVHSIFRSCVCPKRKTKKSQMTILNYTLILSLFIVRYCYHESEDFFLDNVWYIWYDANKTKAPVTVPCA
jgi:hypothetical protein